MLTFPGKALLRNTLVERARRSLDCVFVLSSGRVGTTTLTMLLDASEEIDAYHEPSPLYLTESKEAYQSHPWTEEEGWAFAWSYANARFLRQSPSYETLVRRVMGRGVFAECSNRLTYVALPLARFFETSKFIFLHRDPPGVIRSAMRRRYYEGHVGDPYRIEPREGDPFYEEWAAFSPFQKSCWYWRATNEFALESVRSLSPERSFELRSEALFKQDVEELLRLFDWIDAEPPSESEMRAILSVRHNSQDQREFPKWPQWTETMRGEMTEIVGPVATELGYEAFLG